MQSYSMPMFFVFCVYKKTSLTQLITKESLFGIEIANVNFISFNKIFFLLTHFLSIKIYLKLKNCVT